MLPAVKLQVSNPNAKPLLPLLLHRDSVTVNYNLHSRRSADLRLPKLFCFSSLSLQSDDVSESPTQLSSSIGSSPPSVSSLVHWNLTQRHVLMLNAIACTAAISASWIFFSTIPTLMSFKRAAESLEKLMDTMREELPDTMAAVRLSGMEISDLTMELSDLGQEITKGVRSSTQAVRIAEDRLRQFTTMAPTAMVQEQANRKTETAGLVLARTARGLREGIMKGRAIIKMFFSVTQFSRLALNYFASRRQKL